jgi:hypothetical protein
MDHAPSDCQITGLYRAVPSVAAAPSVSGTSLNFLKETAEAQAGDKLSLVQMDTQQYV